MTILVAGCTFVFYGLEGPEYSTPTTVAHDWYFQTSATRCKHSQGKHGVPSLVHVSADTSKL